MTSCLSSTPAELAEREGTLLSLLKDGKWEHVSSKMSTSNSAESRFASHSVNTPESWALVGEQGLEKGKRYLVLSQEEGR